MMLVLSNSSIEVVAVNWNVEDMRDKTWRVAIAVNVGAALQCMPDDAERIAYAILAESRIARRKNKEAQP
jgi:hypothetical protein